MKLLVSYQNCQGTGLIQFLRKTSLVNDYEFHHFNNYQIILGEQSPEDLNALSAKCHVFIYQPTPSLKYGSRSTEDMLANVVPPEALRLCMGYGFNHGLFPVVHHGDWQTSQRIKTQAREDPAALLRSYDSGSLHFECAARFLDCLAEQHRRETTTLCDIPMADFVLTHYQHEPLFLSENHPASAYFAELARRVAVRLGSDPASIPWSDPNETGLPCSIPLHRAVVCELGLGFGPEPGADKFYREQLEKMAASLRT